MTLDGGLRICLLILLVPMGGHATELGPRLPVSPPLTAANPSNPAKLTLGQRLFSETALSLQQTYSCATCHQPERHFTDGKPRALAADGNLHRFNTPTLYNVAFNSSFG